ncbi:MAG: LysM peptidoglycan-binding domain-containing protein [Actinobacteria bacterium]|nr:LysM peptidoglycan-binding domain-containing protein [Actinomycetota bacterium]
MRRTRVRWSRVLVLAAALLLSVPTVSAVFGGHAEAGTRPRTTTVRPGDTLWAIAQRFCDPGEDIRALVYDITQANGVDAGSIQPGQSLQIP